MDENNLNGKNINSNNMTFGDGQVMTGRPMMMESPVWLEGNAGSMRESKRKKLILIGIPVLILLVVIVTVVAMMLLNQKTGTGSGGSGSTIGGGNGVSTVGIADLSAGEVETTIDGKNVKYKAKYVVDGIAAEVESGTYESTNDNEVVFLVINGGTLILKDNVVVNKTGSADFDGRKDEYSFYGTNSAIVSVGEGSFVTLDGISINTSVAGANAVVATNSAGAAVINATINTTGDSSRGLHATYDGKIMGNDSTITTKGKSCAALATDRGEGTIEVTGMNLSTAGAGSPLIYSTGTIKVSSSIGTATGAQIAVVEGKNSITLDDCDFSANGIGNRDYIDNAAVMIYQSMSGDASSGEGSFIAKNCQLTVLSDSAMYDMTPFFFVTNTTAKISLSNVGANFYENGYFILAKGTDEWGQAGANGAIVTIDAENLTSSSMNIGADNISSVTSL